MKLIWVSDIHLNFLGPHSKAEFFTSLKYSEGDEILITGDIAEGHNIVPLLAEMQLAVGKPIHYVLGNHDYYCSSIAVVKRSVKSLGYLGKTNRVVLSVSSCLIGVDGWGDCRNGDYENSRLTMSDWIHIADLKKHYLKGMDELKIKLQRLADKDAKDLKKKVLSAIEYGFKKIIIATHVPPFKDVCLYAGHKSTDSGLCFFSSKILGDTILPIAKKNPSVDFLWLSGHTHSRAKFKPCNNMTVKVAKAEYYYPQIESVIEV